MTVVLIFALVAIAYFLIIRRFFPHALEGRRPHGGMYRFGYSTPAHLRHDDPWPHQHGALTSTVHADAPSHNDNAYTGGGADFGGFGGGGDFAGGGAGGGFGDGSNSSYTDSSSYSDSGSSSSDSGGSSSSSSGSE